MTYSRRNRVLPSFCSDPPCYSCQLADNLQRRGMRMLTGYGATFFVIQLYTPFFTQVVQSLGCAAPSGRPPP